MDNHKYIRKKSQKQEARTAKEFAGRTQIASGAIETLKGDVRTGETSSAFNVEDFLIENKFTDAKKYKLDLKTWQKIEKEALQDNMRTPMMQIDIDNRVQLVVMSLNDFEGLGYTNNFNHLHDVQFLKTKSYSMDGDFYEGCVTKHMRFMQKLVFLREGRIVARLIVVDKDDFLRNL
jgi:hypothetical protein